MLVGFLACYSPGLFGKNDWAAQNSGLLGLEPKMCPKSAPKKPIFVFRAQKGSLFALGANDDYAHRKIWVILDHFNLVNHLPLSRTPLRFGSSK